MPANNSCGYQILDCSRHTVTKYLNDEKTQSSIYSKVFKHFNHIKDQLCEVEVVKPEIEHRQSNYVGFFILHYVKQRMLEFY